ncbi:hypothetical protein WJ74_07350 [Burkholderia ubonensis]|nr:hypothetical protein WJ74_07350 [Burkholderia ubonensis]
MPPTSFRAWVAAPHALAGRFAIRGRRNDSRRLRNRRRIGQVKTSHPFPRIFYVRARQIGDVCVQCVRLRIAQHTQDTVHKHVRLRQAFFRSTKAREVARADHQTRIRALDVDVRTIKFFPDRRLAAQALDEQFA